jgi:hypothetical protein
MQNRSHRIQFPAVSSEELWGKLARKATLETPRRGSATSLSNEHQRTPFIATSCDESPTDNLLKFRQRAGLITPAATPSDILQQGPLYATSSDEESYEAPQSAEVGMEELHKRIEYHQERQRVIEKSILEFEEKMRGLLDWHKNQEMIHSSLLQTYASRSSLRRGRSKLSERLYEAIDLSGG